MEGQDLIQEIAKCVPIASNEYSGYLDTNGLKTNTGDEQWRYDDPHGHYQRYRGQFLQNSLHGKGKYSWTLGDQQTVYEGRFYANDLEGYGKFSYNDASFFEGLFKSNTRFGPGVFTYPDGSQDVGMWMGKDLMRLCCVVKPKWVPRLAKTPTAKIKLLKFRKLVSVCNTSKDRAKDILAELEVNEDVMQQSDKLYNVLIRNPKSHFFNTTLYDNDYFCKKDSYIEVALTPEEEKAHYQEEALQKIKSAQILEEQPTNNPFIIHTDNECICDDPKQMRMEELRSELEHTEELLTRMKDEIRKAKFRKQLAQTRIDQKDDLRKSVGWERIEVIGGSSNTIARSACDEMSLRVPEFVGEDELSVMEQYELEEEDVDCETACKLFIAAQNAEKLLLLKKDHLTNKLLYETTTAEEIEVENNEPPTKRILITDLLAWNNQETSTDMLKHVFLHRNFEKDVSYCVSEVLTGDRSEFRNAGSYEDACISYLECCSDGNVRRAAELLREHDLNPDLCDAKGNTGVSYAASRDKIGIIRALVNFGANLDFLNDECFTPLGMCIARYLAVQHDVNDWESAFLTNTSIKGAEEAEVREWRPHVSLTSINIFQAKSTENVVPNRWSRQSSRVRLEAISELFGSNLDISHSNFLGSIGDIQTRLLKLKTSQDFQEAYGQKITDPPPQPYLLNIDSIKPPPEKKVKEKKGKKDKKGKKEKSPKGKKDSKKSDKDSKKSDKSSKKSGKQSPKISEPAELPKVSIEIYEMKPEEVLRNNKLSAIYDTITSLLKYGADPNACEVPIPTLILAIFTKNFAIVADLLSSKANPNVTTRDDGLTPLHVLLSLPPCEELVQILKLLLNNCADPNCRTSVHHWVEQKRELLGQYVPEEEDEGKTPLHLLSMRYDILTNECIGEMVPTLMEYGGKVKVRYLGHTPLSLAVMRINFNLIRVLLDTKRINPNQLLGERMGVPLTLFILKRYKDVLPDIEACEGVIQLLLEYKANPFDTTIEEIGNVIEFMIKEHEEPPKPEKKGKGDKGKKKGKDKSSGSEKSSKKGKGKKGKGKKGGNVQEQVKGLLATAAKTVLQKHTKGYITKYLYFFVEEEDYYDDISANMAKFLTPQETINILQILVHRDEVPRNYDIMYDLVEFIININGKPNEDNLPPSNFVDIDKMLENFDLQTIPKENGKLNLLEPEAEKHTEKYNVCFQCYRKKHRQLFICPECRVIYFCSQECNKLNNKEKNTIHKCGTLFYNEQKEIHEERLARGAHWQRTSEIRKNLPELMKQAGFLKLSEEDLFDSKRAIARDPKRRLHLTRDLRSARSKQFPGGKEDASGKLDGESKTALGKKPSGVQGDSILSIRWRQEGSEFLSWTKKTDEGRLDKKGKHGRGDRKSKGYFSDEEVGGKGGGSDRKHRTESEERARGKRTTSKGRSSYDNVGGEGVAKGEGRGGAAKGEGRGGAGKSGGRGRESTESDGPSRGGAGKSKTRGGAATGEGRGDRDGAGRGEGHGGAGKGEGRGGVAKGEGRGDRDEAGRGEGRGGAGKGEGRGGVAKGEGRGDRDEAGRGEGRGGAGKGEGRGGVAKGEGRGDRDEAGRGEGRGGAGKGEGHGGAGKGEGRGGAAKGEGRGDRDGAGRGEGHGGAGKGGGHGGAGKGEGRGGVAKGEGRGGAAKGEGRGDRDGAGRGEGHGGAGKSGGHGGGHGGWHGGAGKGEGRGGAAKDEGRGDRDGAGRGQGHGGAGKGEGHGGAGKGGGRGGVAKGEGRGGAGKGGEYEGTTKGEGKGGGTNRGKGLDLPGGRSLEFDEEDGYTPLPTGGRIFELQRRLPSKYQYFLEKISEYWPDFDFSMIFLPYACYSNGQLYYRFLSNRPVFMETYSNN